MCNLFSGVRQGCVLTPVLLLVYVDDILKLLQTNGLGCYMCGRYVSALLYADDLILIFVSLYDMQLMKSII